MIQATSLSLTTEDAEIAENDHAALLTQMTYDERRMNCHISVIHN